MADASREAPEARAAGRPAAGLPAGQAGSVWRRRLLFLAVAFVVLYFPNLYPRFLSPNEASRLYLTKSIVERGSFAIDAEIARGGGEELSDLAKYGGHYYCDKAPGVSFLAVPAYGLWHLVTGRELGERGALVLARWTVVTLPLLLALGLLLRRPEATSPFALLLVVGLFLGSPLFSQGLALIGHVPMALLLFWLFRRLFRRPAATPGAAFGQAVADGALCALAILVDYTAGLFVVLFVAAALVRRPSWREAAGLALGAAPLLALLLAYNAACFSGPLDIAYNHMAQPVDRAHRTAGFFGIAAPEPEALWGLTFGAERGIFLHSPFLLLLFPAAVRLWRRRGVGAEHLFAAAVILGYLWVNASLVDWQGGWSLGPRYLAPIYPFCAWLVFSGLGGAAASGRSARALRLFTLVSVAFAGLLHLLAIATWSLPVYGGGFVFPALQVSWFLLRHGALAANLGQAAGLSGAGSLLPPALALLAALLAASRRPLLTAAAFALALLLLAAAGQSLQRDLGPGQGRPLAGLLLRMGYLAPPPR